MPIYDYDCEVCGPFTAVRPMAEFRAPCACPACGIAAMRTLLSAPAIAGLGSSGRSAPAVAAREARSQGPTKAAHPAGCGCCTRRAPIPGALAGKGRVFASSGPPPRSGR